jgi:hypothetical protein
MPGELDSDMKVLPGRLAWFGRLAGIVRGEVTKADAAYRRWRAVYTNQILEADSKVAEWKMKAAIESHPDFIAHKNRLAELEEMQETLFRVLKALETKGDLMQSRGANIRAELERLGMNTPGPERGDDGARRERVAESIRESRTGTDRG